ncbi:MAG: hypothetical protein IIC95_11055 [Chloroflexi bacterium]|nr:hypothetical protein [Chloroflexota bacterium]
MHLCWGNYEGPHDHDIPLAKIVGAVMRAKPSAVSFEHPELVAQRIATFAGIVGRERVLAGVDCGFGTFAGYGKMDPDICYAKLRVLAEGAAIASSRLWG